MKSNSIRTFSARGVTSLLMLIPIAATLLSVHGFSMPTATTRTPKAINYQEFHELANCHRGGIVIDVETSELPRRHHRCCFHPRHTFPQ